MKNPQGCVPEVLAEIDQFDPTLFKLDADMEGNETVLGPLPEWLQKAHGLWRWYTREAARMRLEASFEPQNEDLIRRGIEMNYKMDLLSEIMWFSSRASFNAWGDHGIGVRVVNGQMVLVSIPAEGKRFEASGKGLSSLLRFLLEGEKPE